MAGVVLPYRTSAEDLIAWVQARARGRSAGQLRHGAPAKATEGLTQTAAALGVVADDELTERGEALALADASDRRARLAEALAAFPPYRALFEAVRDGRQSSLETAWIEAWWATRGWGSSPSNRQEGSATLGRLAEHVGLGRYVAGRRGHPTRIEWDVAALSTLLGSRAHPPEPSPAALTAERPPDTPVAVESTAVVNRVEVLLEGGRSARLELPSALPRGEKRRLMELVDLLVAEE